MTADEILDRNHHLTTWTVRLDRVLDRLVMAHSDRTEITRAFNELVDLRDEMDAYCLSQGTEPKREPLYKCPRCGSFSEIDYFIDRHICETIGQRPTARDIEHAKAIRVTKSATVDHAKEAANDRLR